MNKETSPPHETPTNPVFTELSPEPGRHVDPLLEVPREERTPHQARPWVLTNMVSSLDGATALKGLSGGLGDESDRIMFRGLRRSADAIIVGARTAAAEQYRRPQPNHEGKIPLLVIVSSRLSLPSDLPALLQPLHITDLQAPGHQLSPHQPLVATTSSAAPDRRQLLQPLAEVTDFGSERVDLDLLLRDLRSRGIGRVLLEGGPQLNGHFVAEDLVDEWNLTISPILVSGPSSRPAHGPESPGVRELDLARLWQSQNMLFGRWIRPKDSAHLASLSRQI